MLAMQASNLEQQERLFKRQIRLGLREILQQEMSFYISAFQNINTCGSILAGFAFSGLLLSPYDGRSDSLNTPVGITQSQSQRLATIFNTACCTTCCLSLLTLIYANYLGLFSSRLALRGGEFAVEHTVTRLRREYKVVLHLLTCSVLSFLLILPVLAFMKMEKTDTVFVTCIAFPSFILVVFLYNRARKLFYLNKAERFAKSRGSGQGRTKGKNIDLAGSWADSDTSFTQHTLRKSLVSEDTDNSDQRHSQQGVFHSKRGQAGWAHLDGNRYSEVEDVPPRFSKQFIDENSKYGGGGGGGGSGGGARRHPEYYRGYVEGSLSSKPVDVDQGDYLRGFIEGSLTSSPPNYGPHYNEDDYYGGGGDDRGGGGGGKTNRRQTVWGSFLGGEARRRRFSRRSIDDSDLSAAFDGRSGNRKWSRLF